MKNSKTTATHARRQSNANPVPEQAPASPPPVIKLGVDWHAQWLVVARMIDGLTPQAAQRFPHAGFLDWVRQQVAGGARVVVVYEAGPGGFHLYRQMVAVGAGCYVIHPQRLGPRGGKVANDARDARELVLLLDLYLRGNQRAMRVVRVPAPAEEQCRALGRQREQVRRDLQRLAAQGRSLALQHGIRLRGEWWEQTLDVPAWLEQRLAVWRELILAFAVQLEQLSAAVAELAPKARPKGLGPLTLGLLVAELCRWDRFTNRKQIGGYAGLGGGVASSGQSHCDLAITKAGNARVRWLLVEAAWRLVLHQPQCPTVQRWRRQLLTPGAHVRQKKRAIVAVARQLGVDLWRWQTGRVTPQQLGWIMV